LTVSDTLSNIFEKIILKDTEDNYDDPGEKFGFKKIVLVCTQLFFKRTCLKTTKAKNKKMYVTSIDAPKAFEKVNRHFLWSEAQHRIDSK
jgi:hypothetical protein